MKKLLLTLSIALITLASTAQITVNVPTAGGFSTSLTNAGGNANTVTNLIVTGNIDARDVKFMRDNMPLLAILDLSAVQIMAYTGTGGTYIGSTTYPSNQMPQYSFCTPNTYVGKTSLTGIKLPNSITTIGQYTFFGCTGLTGSLSIPNSVTSIGEGAFSVCIGFTGSLSIPNSVTSIGAGAFMNCSGFTSLSIPNSVTFIWNNAFWNCDGFTGSLIIPNSVTYIGAGAIASCDKIISITVDDNNPNFSSIDGVLFNKAKTKLIQCPAGKVADSYIIPNSVTSIGESAFTDCNRLTGSLIIPNSVTSIDITAFSGCSGFTGSLTIPNSVTSIGIAAFSGCSGFTGSLTIPNSVTSIGIAAFSGCSGFTGSLIIPNSVSSIEYNTFRSCSGFTSLIIPNSVTSIGDYVFGDCSGLQKIVVAKSMPLSISQNTFNNVNKTTCELVVPVGTKAAYQAANYWKDFTNITELNNGLLVHYNSQGGSAVSDVVAEINTSITAPIAPTKTGYTFAGWYKEAACTNAWNFASDLVTTNTTLYARWTTTYRISFNSQGGSAVSDVVAELNTSITAPIAPTKTGYTFAGWYKEAACTNAWNFASDLVTTNTTLYARWTITYRVSFNSQGGSAVSDVVAELNTSITAPIAPTKTGYTFAGWYKEAACTNAWNFASDLVTTNTTLYARWTITYRVSFNSQGGSAVSDVVAELNTSITAPIAPTKTGYTFAGWYKEAACTNAWNFASDLVTTNTTLYARWTITYRVSFNSQGGSAVSDVVAELNTSITTPIAPTKEGYTFAGWYKEEACTNAWDFTTDLVTNNITLYVKWTINTYTVNFNPQGGTAVFDISALYNTKITSPIAPTKTGYTFAGWYKEEACTNAWNFASDLVATNTTLYAKWTASPTSIANIGTSKLRMFPNPAAEFVKIESKKLQTITIYNLKGSTLQQLNLHGEESVNINLGHLPTGYYLVKVKTGDGAESIMKLVKN